MRKLAAIALLFSVQAFACPNLTGSFKCTYGDGSTENVTITQSEVNGVTVYNYNGSEMPADNQTYQIPDSEDLKEGTWRAWCDDDSTLKAELIGKYYNQGSYFGDLNMRMDFSIDGTSLKQVTNGNLKNTGGDYPINDEMTCVAN